MTTDDADVQWINEQRNRVLDYLDREGVFHGGVPPRPEWFLAPFLAIWVIASSKRGGGVGWWAISGDGPTDHLGGSEAVDVRSAVAAFAAQWREVAECMVRGEAHPEMTVGGPHNRLELGELLLRRSQLLAKFATDDETTFPDEPAS